MLCPACKIEIAGNNKGCTCKKFRIDGVWYNRIPMGAPGDPYEDADSNQTCGDCGVHMGEYHHYYCDMEHLEDGTQVLQIALEEPDVEFINDPILFED